MFFLKYFTGRDRWVSVFFLIPLCFAAISTTASTSISLQASPSPSATSTPAATVCDTENLTAEQNKACLDFFMRYSASEYSGVLGLPDRVEVVTGYTELVDCFDSENNSICADSKNNHYLILLDAHNFEIQNQVVELARQRSYSLKAVYLDTTIRLSRNVDTRNNGSGALMRFGRTGQLIIDGITWDTHENTANPAVSPSPSPGDDPSEMIDLALEIRHPAGPVIIRGNTFRHTGRQIGPIGFINIHSPDPDPAQGEEGLVLVEIRDNEVDSSNLYNDMNFNDGNDTTAMLFIECGNQDRNNNRSCEKTYARITDNVFVENSEDFGSGSSLSSVIPSLTSTFNLSPSTTPKVLAAVERSAIKLENIGKFIIEGNRQEDMGALANIRIEYNNEQAISVDGIIRDNIGHVEALDEVSPTITLTNSEDDLPATGSIRISNNSWYRLLDQLTLPGIRVLSDSGMISSQGSEIASQVTSVLAGSSFSGHLPATTSIDQSSMLASLPSFSQVPGSTMIAASPGMMSGGGLTDDQIVGIAVGAFFTVVSAVVIAVAIVICVVIAKSGRPVGEDTVALKDMQ